MDIPQTEQPTQKAFSMTKPSVPQKTEKAEAPTKKGLDEYQQSSVTNESNQLLITAGPGSGKTTVLTKRIEYLISEKMFHPKMFLR